MAGMGPPPKPANQRRRKNLNAPDLTRLPAEGRKGRAPAWPIGTPAEAERAVWRQLWATPQATAWDHFGWTRVVARYVRLLLAAEEEGAPASLLSEVRQLEDRLGLSPMAMLRLRWQIEPEPTAEYGTVVTVADDRWRHAGSAR